MTGTFRNVTGGPVELDGGRILAPEETADLQPGSDHNQRLEDAGQIVRVHEPDPKERNK